MYTAMTNTSEAVYENTRQAIHRRYPRAPGQASLPSHDAVTRLVERISGVVPIRHDMCPNSCVAYTGPYAARKDCPICGEQRYDPLRLASSNGEVEVPRQSFCSIPIGPQLQALYCHPTAARAMAYRARKTELLHQNVSASVYSLRYLLT
ncbi:hypothetical protein EV122DRAFT_294165 [Schizophyllum commune]